MPHGEYATSSYSVQTTTVASGFVRLAIDPALMPAAPPPITQMFIASPIVSGLRACFQNDGHDRQLAANHRGSASSVGAMPSGIAPSASWPAGFSRLDGRGSS